MSNTDVIDADLKFNALTFISPFIVIYDHLDCSTEQVYSCEEEAEINYGYVVMIAVGIKKKIRMSRWIKFNSRGTKCLNVSSFSLMDFLI